MKKLMATIVLLALAVPVFAENLYGAVTLGAATKTDATGLGLTSKDMSDAILLGYKVNSHFAVEAGYGFLFNNSNISNTDGAETIKGYEIASVGSYPIHGAFSLIGRLGYAWLDYSDSFNGSATLSGYVYGAGVQYDINKKFGTRAGYNIYNLSSNNPASSGGDAIVNNTYVSVLYNF